MSAVQFDPPVPAAAAYHEAHKAFQARLDARGRMLREARENVWQDIADAQAAEEARVFQAKQERRAARAIEARRKTPSIYMTQCVMNAVQEKYHVSRNDIMRRRGKKATVRARFIAIYLVKNMTVKSLPTIGKLFDGRDYTTISYAVDKIAALVETDPEFAAEMASLEEKIRDELCKLRN